MNYSSTRILRILFAIISTSLIISGCGQGTTLGLIEVNETGIEKEFSFDNYRMKIQITPTANNLEYIYSFSLFNKSDGTLIRDVNSYLDIKKYSARAQPSQRKYLPTKHVYENELKPSYDSEASYYKYKYKFKNKGKYELIIRLREIAGNLFDDDILISFDQNII
ncbi:MAG: hypothetical protein KKA84_09165 [Bacteroidetes bacterium]|nr:hypothetical protein [Bacteroidota bacterium]